MTGARGSAHGRAALLGNPSDGYGGRTISFVVPNFTAEVTVAESEQAVIEPSAGRVLLEATLRRFRGHFAGRGAALPETPVSMSWRTTIPREVGLGGSSAIVIAALRALCSLYGQSIASEVLPSLALSVETDELGINAGLQDRVAQTYGGLTYMDFDPDAFAARGCGIYEPLDPALLPPLFVAYRTDTSEPSAAPHADLRRRYDAGHADVVAAMDEIADLAQRGRECLLAGDQAGLRHLADRNFEARGRLYPLDPRHVRMVELARSLGASANYAGSGGAIVGILGDRSQLAGVREAFQRDRCAVVVPKLG